MTEARLIAELHAQGYARRGPGALDWLPTPAVPGWEEFARSWDRLGIDRYMADGGRYRRRRHAALAISDGAITRKPHQPHFQSRDYNPLNGDIQRWFTPVEPAILELPLMRDLLAGATRCFEAASGPIPQAWHVELHQFRIEATSGRSGQPTPEGMHRDGVNWVLVLLVDRQNVRDGETRIQSTHMVGSNRFTLSVAGDVVLLDDRRVMHGVTPVLPLDPRHAGHRDVLIATWSTG